MRSCTTDSQVYCLSNLNVTFFVTQMSNEIHGILYSNVQPVSGGAYQSAPRDEESFLREVVTPIYEVLRKVADIIYALIYAVCHATWFQEVLKISSLSMPYKPLYIHYLRLGAVKGSFFLDWSIYLRHHLEERPYFYIFQTSI